MSAFDLKLCLIAGVDMLFLVTLVRMFTDESLCVIHKYRNSPRQRNQVQPIEAMA
jgi:hypothetical protein